MRILVILLLSLVSAQVQSKTYYNAQIESIDKNNVMRVTVDGKKRYITFGYMKTPVHNEVFHQQFRALYDEKVNGKLLKITELGYGKNASVKPVFIRNTSGELINLTILRAGLGIPNDLSFPPPQIINAANSAKSKKAGIWSQLKLFQLQRRQNEKSNSLYRLKTQIDMSATGNKRSDLKMVVGNPQTMVAYPMNCISTISKPVLMTTKYVALNKGYRLAEKCF